MEILHFSVKATKNRREMLQVCWHNMIRMLSAVRKMHCEQFAMKRSITTKTQLDMLSFPYRNRICIPYMRYIYIYIYPSASDNLRKH